MKTFNASASLEKLVDTWGPDGAGCKSRHIFHMGQQVNSDTHTGIFDALADWIDSLGLDLSKFSVFEEDDRDPIEGRRFTFNRVEDNDGNADDDGTWLADYDLIVRLRICEPTECPTFGLPTL